MLSRFLVIYIYLCLPVNIIAQNVDTQCYHGRSRGVCVPLNNCPTAEGNARAGLQPKVCFVSRGVTFVCCISSVQPATASTQGSTATPRIGAMKDQSDCPPVPPQLTAPKTGRKAWDKCIEYQENLVYRCVRTNSFSSTKNRVTQCPHKANELIVGGTNAARREYPHMALLGFGDEPQTASWSCGGTLISERYVLTAGHCTEYNRVKVSLVRLAVLDMRRMDNKHMYRVGDVIKHPLYRSPAIYNDIALLRTAQEMKLSAEVVPACLPIDESVAGDKAIATGWGKTKYNGETSNVLQKIILEKFTDSECAAKYYPNRKMDKGIDVMTQTCYGGRTESKDACQGDSGGPLQIKNRQISCMYTVVGVTSFGNDCGMVGKPGVFTKVSVYVPWIESIVWP